MADRTASTAQVTSLTDSDWKEVAAALTDEAPDEIRDLVETRLGHHLARDLERAVNILLDGSDQGGMDIRLDEAFSLCIGKSGCSALLIAYTYLLLLHGWELTSAWSALAKGLRVLDDRATATRPRLSDEERQLIDGLLDRARRMSPMLEAESALNCSSADRYTRHTAEVARDAQRSVGWCRDVGAALPGPYRTLVDELARSATADLNQYNALTGLGTATQVLNDWDRDKWEENDLGSKLDSAFQGCRKAALESETAEGPVAAVELLTHAATLGAMSSAAPQSFLRPGAIKVVYLYPFGLDLANLKWADLEARAGELVKDAPRGLPGGGPEDREGPRELPGLFCRQMEVTDMWPRAAGTAEAEGMEVSEADRREYPGLELGIPSGIVEHGDETERPLLVESTLLRLLELGNHYLRIEMTIDAASLHDLYRAMRRGSSEAGDEVFTVAYGGSSQSWPRLFDYAQDVITSFAHAMHVTAHLPKAFHVILSIHSLMLVPPDGQLREATEEDLAERSAVVGRSLLLQPVRQCVASLEEWLRIPAPNLASLNLFQGYGYTGDVAIRTFNTTVFAITRMPDFLLREYEELAELAASLSGVFETQRAQLARVKGELRQAIDAFEHHTAKNMDLRKLPQLMATLAHVRLLASESVVSHLAELLRTGSHRQFLEKLLEATDLARMQREVQGEVDRVNALYETILSQQRLLEQVRQERVQSHLSIVIGILALLGLFTAWSFLDDNFSLRWLAGIQLGVTVFAVLWLVFWLKRSLSRGA